MKYLHLVVEVFTMESYFPLLTKLLSSSKRNRNCSTQHNHEIKDVTNGAVENNLVPSIR